MKIVLVCSGGMSTSLLVEAMKKEAASQKISCDIEAISLSLLPEKIKDISCLLVAPQVRHRLKGIEETAQKFNKPVAVVEGQAYGRIDGKAVLKQALALACSS